MSKKEKLFSAHLPEGQAETSHQVIWIELDGHGGPFTHAKTQRVLQVMNLQRSVEANGGNQLIRQIKHCFGRWSTSEQ